MIFLFSGLLYIDTRFHMYPARQRGLSLSTSRDVSSTTPLWTPPPIGIHGDIRHEISSPRRWDVTASCPSVSLMHDVDARVPYGRLDFHAVRAVHTRGVLCACAVWRRGAVAAQGARP